VRHDLHGPGGTSDLYEVDGVRVDTGRLEELRDAYPWLSIGVTIDRQALLAERPAFGGRRNGNGYGGRPAAAAPEVPF